MNSSFCYPFRAQVSHHYMGYGLYDRVDGILDDKSGRPWVWLNLHQFLNALWHLSVRVRP